MAGRIILAVDIGTTETKTVLIDSKKGHRDSRQGRNSLLYPEEHCVEQSPGELAETMYRCVRELIDGNRDLVKEIAGVTFTSQMMNLIPVDRQGTPLMNSISWMDERAAGVTVKKMIRGWPKVEGYPLALLLRFLRISGGIFGVNGKDNISRMVWLKEFRPEIYGGAHKFLDIKDYALFLATGNFVTSADSAFVTWLVDTRQKDQKRWTWSKTLFKEFGLDPNKMPNIILSTDRAGAVTEEFSQKTGVPAGLPVIAGAGDLLTTAIGSGAVEPGEIHINIGTAGWVATHFPGTAIDTKHYAGTIASGMPETYLLLSKQETLGGAIDWVTGVLCPAENRGKKNAEDLYEELNDGGSYSSPGSGGLIFTPWLFGERSPVNDPNLRGQIFNISLNTKREDVFRAVLEGIAYNLRWGIEVVERLVRKKGISPHREIRLIGGGSRSGLLCQIIADVLQRPAVQMKSAQYASALGVSAIAMKGLGIWEDFREVNNIAEKGERFEPDLSNEKIYNLLYGEFRELYGSNRKIFHRLNAGTC